MLRFGFTSGPAATGGRLRSAPAAHGGPSYAVPGRRVAPLLVAGLLLAVTGIPPSLAAERCDRELQSNPCAEANPVCPPAAGPLGVSAGSWPVFQGNVQHTGQSGLRGPDCNKLLWSSKLTGGIVSAPILAPGRPGEAETLFVPVGKAPLCALHPGTGAVLWCGTDELGKLVDRASPVVGNGSSAFVGTRDNDLWAIAIPPRGSANATVTWRQKVCTDGDVTAPPIIAADGLIYMASDSLGAGTLMAMCPGPTRQPKWCVNPVGGGIRNASPALSPSGHELYVLFGGGFLGAFDPQTGAVRWQVQLEPKRSVGRIPNLTPVVHPVTGRIYLGLNHGLWAIDPPPSPGGAAATSLLLDTRGAGQLVETPPALDVERGRIVVGASNGPQSTLYALGLDGGLLWRRDDLGVGRFRANNPPVIDRRGLIYLTLGKSLIALRRNGSTLWRREFASAFESSPILGRRRLYAGTNDGTVHAIGGCGG